MPPDLESLITIANQYGSNPAYIQGGGGNVSIKISETDMLVKASGLRLDALRPDYGLVGIRYPELRHHYHSFRNEPGELHEHIAKNDEQVQAVTIKKETETLRPSIETGFHAVLGRVVIHTHNVFANLLTCSVEGAGILETLFPESSQIPYRTPGVALTYAIQDTARIRPSSVYFLENHGIITIGNTPREAYELHEAATHTIMRHFGLTAAEFPSLTISSAAEATHEFQIPSLKLQADPVAYSALLRNTILFPDQVVYTDTLSTDSQATTGLFLNPHTGTFRLNSSYGFALAAAETILAWSYIFETMERLGLTPKSLDSANASIISNLDSEKYRKQIA